MKTNEVVFRPMFEKYCKEGMRPLMFSLKRLAGGEYASPFTERAWKTYWRGVNDGRKLYKAE